MSYPLEVGCSYTVYTVFVAMWPVLVTPPSPHIATCNYDIISVTAVMILIIAIQRERERERERERARERESLLVLNLQV